MPPQFLMYRVELKGLSTNSVRLVSYPVPNVPCGVERALPCPVLPAKNNVPNVPCGVESRNGRGFNCCPLWVPNVPCGVESNLRARALLNSLLFLMYRVELKAGKS